MKKNASVYVLLAPYFILFTIFTIIPVLLSLPMGFTNFNMVQFPQFVGLSNFYSLILEDEVFLKAIQNTLVFAIITGPLSYIMCFILAWLINEMPRALKTMFTFIFYAPTLAGNIYTTWQPQLQLAVAQKRQAIKGHAPSPPFKAPPSAW